MGLGGGENDNVLKLFGSLHFLKLYLSYREPQHFVVQSSSKARLRYGKTFSHVAAAPEFGTVLTGAVSKCPAEGVEWWTCNEQGGSEHWNSMAGEPTLCFLFPLAQLTVFVILVQWSVHQFNKNDL